MSNAWLPIAAAVAAGLFGTGGIVAFLKIRPEAGQIVVTAAQGAVVVQTGVIDTLREQAVGLRDEISALKIQVGDCATTNRLLTDTVQRLEKTNARLSATVDHLERTLRSKQVLLDDRQELLHHQQDDRQDLLDQHKEESPS